jgi:hypothetical protein
MSVVVYKEFRPLVKGKRKAVHVPYTLYTIQEADEKGIPYERDWRLKFRDLQDLTGKNIVTDDDPPMVVPIIDCKCLSYNPKNGKNRPYRHLRVPWTYITSYKRELRVGVPATADKVKMCDKRKRMKPHQFKLFVIMLALMGDPHKVVQQLFGFKAKIEQIRFFRAMMEDKRTYDAASSIAYEVLSEAGIEPKEVAKKLWAILEKEETPVHLKIKGYQDLLDRLGVKDKPAFPDAQGLIAGALFAQPIGGADVDLRHLLAKEVSEHPPGKNTRRQLTAVSQAGNRDEGAQEALSPSDRPPDPA